MFYVKGTDTELTAEVKVEDLRSQVKWESKISFTEPKNGIHKPKILMVASK